MDGQWRSEDLARLEALVEPTRRRLYEYVAGRGDAVGRDEAARELGLPRHAAKFHLDRLVEAGLLTTEFRRLSGRTGPGAGRPAKLYRRARAEVSVSVPPRHYGLVAEVLADAVERATARGEPLASAVEEAARAAGVRLAPEQGADDVVGALAALGYAPRAGDGLVELANCPYQALAARHTELVCGLNAALVEGLLTALPSSGATSRLDPAPGRCCVVVDLPSERSA
jgi:predicted ArsR family transcriptional regulator